MYFWFSSDHSCQDFGPISGARDKEKLFSFANAVTNSVSALICTSGNESSPRCVKSIAIVCSLAPLPVAHDTYNLGSRYW